MRTEASIVKPIKTGASALKRSSNMAHSGYDVGHIRKHFSILSRTVHGKPLVYLDNAATTQKPKAVIDSISHYYSEYNSNIHRGVHQLSQDATDGYEKARRKVRDFINAREDREIIFVRGTTEAINLVAQTFGKANIRSGDEILISTMEHHSNIVPWQMLCAQTGALLRVIPISDNGELKIEEFERLLGARTKLVSICHVSNALGTINPIQEIIQFAHNQGVPVLLDGAQAVPHLNVNVEELDCEFYTFSGHKLYGPTGVGVLYGKAKLLEELPPYQGGGDMIRSVTFEGTTYNEIPWKFEAGTPDIAGVIGLGVALDYLTAVGQDAIFQHETELLVYANDVLREIHGLRLVGTAKEKAAVVSFVMDGIHPHDIGTILDREGIAIRTGHHCAQPLMERLGLPATARASFALYNTKEEIDALARALMKVREVFGND